MDINFYAKWTSYAFFVLSAFIHLGFFVLEVFILPSTKGAKWLKASDDLHRRLRPWMLNQGFYNLFLVILIVVGIYHIHTLQVRVAGLLIGLAGLFMITAGLVLGVTQPHLRKWAYWQAIPPLLGFIFLSLHAL